MAIDQKLLAILVCPVSKVPVKLLSKDKLAIFNSSIGTSEIKNIGGEVIAQSLQEALITSDGRTIYPVDDSIPIMLEDQGIAASQIPGW